MSNAFAENSPDQQTVMATDTGNIDPGYQDTVERAKHVYVAMTELALMGVGVMEQACVEAFALPPDAIGMAYLQVTAEKRVTPPPVVQRITAEGQAQAAPIMGARWTRGSKMYPLSKEETAMRASILNLASTIMPRSEYPRHPIYQQTSDMDDRYAFED